MSAAELWYVRLSNGDVHHVTLDQLDVAFDAGHIDADTLVLEDGSTQWKRLGEAAGLDDDAPAEQAPQPVWSAAPQSVAPAPVMSPTPGPVVRTVSATPQIAYAQAPVSRAPVYAQQAPVSRAPVYAQQAPVSRVPASYAPPAGSIRPVAFDLSDDLDLVSYKKRGSSKGWLVAAMSLALVGGGVGYAATHGVGLAAVGGGSSDMAAAAAAPIAPPPADPIPAPAAAPAPAPLPSPQPPAVLGGSLPAMESGLNPRFTDAQKDKLLAADKARSDRASSRQSAYTPPHHYKSSSAFTKGGNKYDPLNSDL
jgi:hypothetical protein